MILYLKKALKLVFIVDSHCCYILLQVMTAHPDCATLDMTILDALHIMHDGKFLHIPVLDGGKHLCFSS